MPNLSGTQQAVVPTIACLCSAANPVVLGERGDYPGECPDARRVPARSTSNGQSLMPGGGYEDA